jgi:hypothetical protein
MLSSIFDERKKIKKMYDLGLKDFWCPVNWPQPHLDHPTYLVQNKPNKCCLISWFSCQFFVLSSSLSVKKSFRSHLEYRRLSFTASDSNAGPGFKRLFSRSLYSLTFIETCHRKSSTAPFRKQPSNTSQHVIQSSFFRLLSEAVGISDNTVLNCTMIVEYL